VIYAIQRICKWYGKDGIQGANKAVDDINLLGMVKHTADCKQSQLNNKTVNKTK